ncbi:hypothetical protein TREMEDRAFT_65157 [Tremella mesenterica DSM 1558]|uniref:uncharacterized protein n=1 Tax=Tremella mesenterica (strain ATCC 24925 / CBS 8224 / DSM 1558 / NBRC 9311 / NRRL Y-6157 / RJB 2259-6 / UBC 559-6) TaxID=578456 RepID=UPI00032BC11E|nr:uncharacterized protein TREMEDRAFT_65157 [Tremella mesenterica DSM 1558]EIW66759.1 hypothetical protein TREMEDRAFT_65157 [Tremella mesenterica DSM 1558]
MGASLYHKLRDIDPQTAVRMRLVGGTLAKASETVNPAQREKDEAKAEEEGRKAKVIAHGQVITEDAAKKLKLGLNSMVAVNEGTSSTWHYDGEDDDKFYTIILVTGDGDWGPEDGVMEIPQLGLRLSLRPGDVFCFRSKILLHSVTPVPAHCHRTSFTFFVSERSTSVMKKAWEEDCDHFVDTSMW